MRIDRILLASLIALFGAATASAAVEKPNIIFIMADDMGTDWVSCCGSAHQTPHIDRLAHEGVRFTNAWCTPICTVTRIELLTGLYPFRTGWTIHHDVPRWGGKGFDWERYTCWARRVREAGYATAIGGKWQVTDFRQDPDALSRHGFDEHCVWTGYETGNAPPSDERYWNAYLMTNGERRIHKDQYGPTVINDFLVHFIERHKDRPFLVYYSMLQAHGPHMPTPFNKDRPPTATEELYGGQVTHLDHLVGRIVATVDRLGLTDKTLIVFTGDNGSPIAGRVNGQPFLPGKGTLTDRGAHVVFVARAPFLTGANVGRVSDDLLEFTDVYPTFLELSGAPRPERQVLNGRSLVALISNSARPSEKRAWIFSGLGPGRMVRDRQYLLDNQGGFYDVKNDPLQRTNLAKSTEAAHTEARARLSAVLEAIPADGPPPFPEYGVQSQ
jgi:arylsulfatase A-like enzyme